MSAACMEIHAQPKARLRRRSLRLPSCSGKGLVKHIGVSNVTPTQIAEARKLVPIVCVQNHYNLAHRDDDGLNKRTGKRRHRLCALFSAGRLYPASVGHPHQGRPPAWASRRCKPHWPGCCSAHRTCWLFQARRRAPICGRIGFRPISRFPSLRSPI